MRPRRDADVSLQMISLSQEDPSQRPKMHKNRFLAIRDAYNSKIQFAFRSQSAGAILIKSNIV